MKVGIGLIGSLLWDFGNTNIQKLRSKWRRDALYIHERIAVKLPIRYGRLSSNGHYTMVMSLNYQEEGKLGVGYVVPSKLTVNTHHDLANVVGQFSNSEGGHHSYTKDQKDSIFKGFKTNWGVITYVLNPSISVEHKRLIEAFYKSQFNNFPSIFNAENFKVKNEGSLLNSNGSCKLEWPNSLDKKEQEKVNEFDVIFITCTVQNISSYPDFKSIFNDAREDPRRYWFNNIKNGILTHDCYDILRK